ncbi:MAG TPA: dTDP-glucose 4,6-dehydratase [Candidatus Nanoarchaeia archaeon]|nr:dTDP-glucose 4,6-dehydratase [Candidatus Nanoarchaeia archaeon]
MDAILVTGAAGFIGSHFVELYLAKHPFAVVVTLDKLTYAGKLTNLASVKNNPNHFFYEGDIGDEPLVCEIIRKHKVTKIVNFAADTHVDNSIKRPHVSFETNIMGTQALLDAARACGIKRFVHISTDEVYGSLATGDATEDFPLLPNSPYSASKAGADLLVRSYVQTYRFPAIITRSSNNFGPRQYPEKVIPLFIRRLLDGKKVPVYGTGKNVRDWLYVEDNCAGIMHVLEHGTLGEIYNIGGGNMITNLELTRKLLAQFERDDSSIEFVTDRPAHDQRYSVDCSKIKMLGWMPQHAFSSALARTVQWYKSHADWLVNP